MGGLIWYQHWWTENLRSTLEVSGVWREQDTGLLCLNSSPCTNTNNKLLGNAHANLFWSPVAFVDFGLEYAWGHRVTVTNVKAMRTRSRPSSECGSDQSSDLGDHR